MAIQKIVIAAGIAVAVALIALFLYRKDRPAPNLRAAPLPEQESPAKKGKKKGGAPGPDDRIQISQRWDMPDVLAEISGIAYMGDHRFACVQDELGEVFIYNTATARIERQIPFGGKGDYEGVAVAGSALYVLRADGQLFMITDYNKAKSAVVTYRTALTAKQDVEGLCFDQKHNRLLLAIKGKEPDGQDYKGIYAFDLATKKLAEAPVFKVLPSGRTSGNGKGKNKIEPSDLDIDPKTGDIYIIDGPNSRLVILGPDGVEKQLYELNDADFPQPEGLSFSDSGELYVSNEGKKGAGNILRLTISRTP